MKLSDSVIESVNQPLPGTKGLGIAEYATDLAGTIIGTYLVVFIVRFLVHQFFKRTNFIDEKKEMTIESVLKNTSNYVAFFVIFLSIIQPFIDLKQLLVAGGVVGIVIGFGAQSAIKDLLYGFFFLFEGQFKKGDFVHVNGELEGGQVDELGFRAVKIRLVNGKMMTISNGEIKKIVNGNIGQRRILEGVVISFRENPADVIALLENVCEQLNVEHQDLLKKDQNGEYIEPYRVFGLSSLDHSPIGFRYQIAATVSDEHYIEAVQRTKELLAQRTFDQKIKMPEQHVFYRTRKE